MVATTEGGETFLNIVVSLGTGVGQQIALANLRIFSNSCGQAHDKQLGSSTQPDFNGLTTTPLPS